MIVYFYVYVTTGTLTFQIVVHIRLFIFRKIGVLLVYGLIRVYTFIRFVVNPPYTIFIWSMFITLKIFNIFEVTVEPLYNGHPWDWAKVTLMER